MVKQLRVRKTLFYSDFIYAARDLTSNVIKLKNCIQNVSDSQSILKYCMIVCEKLISYEYNSEKTVDLCKFHKYEQILITQGPKSIV